jgi:hypothetical protein
VYIKLVVLLRNYVTMMHGQQNIKNGWATIVVVGRLRVNANLKHDYIHDAPVPVRDNLQRESHKTLRLSYFSRLITTATKA